MLERREFYINGGWVSPAVANDLEVIDPSNEEPCAVIALGGQADTDAAVAAAKAAFPGWAATPKAERIALVERILEVYSARAEASRQRATEALATDAEDAAATAALERAELRLRDAAD